METPQLPNRLKDVPDHLKEVPPKLLRAAFAGVGQLLLAADRLRTWAREAHARTAPPPAKPAAPWDTTIPPAQKPAATPHPAEPAAAKAKPAAAPTPAPSPAKPAARRAAAPAKAKSAPAKAKPAAAPAAAAAAAQPAAAASLPIPGYDGLPVASLRARLRVLSEADLGELIAYEQSHERRDTVIAMFERRLVKLRTAPADQPGSGS